MKKEFTEIVDGTEIRYVLDEATRTYLPDWELPEQREELGLDTDGFCNMKMICEWKMDLMAKTIFDNIWVDRQAMAGQVMELIRKHYRLHSAKVVKPEFALVWDFKITYEMAKNWRKAQGAYLRQNQWKDLTVRVCLDVG